MAELWAVVTLTRSKGRDEVDSEMRVKSLDELYQVCRDARPDHVVRVSVRGPEGEVRLNFASFIRKS